MSAEVAIAAALVLLAAPLSLLGRYGWRNASRLAGAGSPARASVVRRGSAVCMAVAALFVVGALAGLVGAW